MTDDEKLAAILAVIQTDPGNRGLGRDPKDNLFNACPGDFAEACLSIARTEKASLAVVTGFYIPTATPPAFETDGPLGALFLARSLTTSEIKVSTVTDAWGIPALVAGVDACGLASSVTVHRIPDETIGPITHVIAIERVGPNHQDRCYTMSGRDVTAFTTPAFSVFYGKAEVSRPPTIGIGDGGNEIGMGKIPHETIVKNIPNGDLIHCRVPTDYLIVAGVSNWGAYALAAGVYILRGIKPPRGLFDPEREREILEVMVREGPLVDGVTGKQTATVDGLSWEEYLKPLVQIREILEI
jgi:D-glutamate cyclase